MARRAKLNLAVNAGAGAGASFDWPGGDGVLFCEATWGGGNVKLEMQSDNGTWLGIQNYATTTAISLTANGTANFRAPAGPMRVNITTSSAVYASAIGVPSNVAG